MSTTRTRRTWSFLGFNNQSSQAAVTHNPNPTGIGGPATLSDSELLQSTSKLLQHFEELRNIERIELSDKRIVAIREEIEKAMPRLQALATGAPVPTPKAVSIKAFAEVFLGNFPEVDTPALRPNTDVAKNGSPLATRPPTRKPKPAATSSAALAAPSSIPSGLSSGPVPPTCGLANVPVQTQGTAPVTPAQHPPPVEQHSVQATSQTRAVAPDGQHVSGSHMPRALAALQIADGLYQAPTRVAMSQKDLLMAVHDLVNRSGLQWGSVASTYIDNDARWKHPPCGLSPDEFEKFQRASKTVLGGGNGHGGCLGTAAPGMGTLVPTADLHSRVGGRPFGHEYMQSVPTGHEFTGNAHVHHRSNTSNRGVGDGHEQKRRTSTESMVK